MGTNYYAKIKICSTCGRPEQEIHLGKMSWGWKFTLQANGFEYYKTWKEMKKWLKGKDIFDEYNEKVTLEDFIKWVEDRQKTREPQDAEYGSQMHIVDGYKFFDCEFS